PSTVPTTLAPSTVGVPIRTSSPSATIRTRPSWTCSPGATARRSTSRVSPGATRYCLPPDSITPYTVASPRPGPRTRLTGGSRPARGKYTANGGRLSKPATGRYNPARFPARGRRCAAVADIYFERQYRTPFSEGYVLLEGENKVGRVDLHFTQTIVYCTLIVERDFEEDDLLDLIQQVDDDLVLSAGVPREDFV